MKVNRDGIMIGAYYVRHRETGEIAIVELGARYDQSQWGLLHQVTTNL